MAISKTAPKKTKAASKAKVAPKKTAAAKKAVKKTSPKKKKEMEIGACYECSVCGLEVSVETGCDCDETCDLMCCGEPMEIL